MTQCHKCHNCPFTSLAVLFMTHCQHCHNCPFASLAISFMTQCIPMQQPPFGARSGWEELAGVQQPLGWTLQIPSWGVQQSSSSCQLDLAGISAREADVVPHSLHNSVNKLMLLVLPMTIMPMLPSCHTSRCQMEGNARHASIRTINGTLLKCSESLRFTSCVGGANPGAKRRANQEGTTADIASRSGRRGGGIARLRGRI